MNDSQLLLIDLSGIAHQLYHVSGNEPDPNFISTKLIERIRGLASAHPHAAVCCDAGKSFRADIDPTYKAQRDTENRAVLSHQMTLACETLARDGFPVWKIPGFEADDIIATGVHEALKIDGATVLIASADKDLLQLVNGRVQQKKTTDGNVMDADAVKEKFGVLPAQMLDYLCLVGDASDNVKGAVGVGAVRAKELLSKHMTLAAVYEAIDRGVVPGITPALRTNLQEFRARWPVVRQLIALRDDAPIPFHEIAVERSAPPMEDADMPKTLTEMSETEFAQFEQVIDPPKELRNATPPTQRQLDVKQDEQATDGLGKAFDTSNQRPTTPSTYVQPPILPYVPPPNVVYSGPVEFSQQLEPRSLEEAKHLAALAFASRHFSAYGTKEGVLMTIMRGREMGLKAMESLSNFHLIDGKPTMSADLIAARVIASGKARYFKCTQRSATAAAFKTLRLGEEEEPFELVYTIEEAKQAWKKDQRAWDASGWGKIPADMLVARAKSKLARLVYPDVVSGLYAPEEME